MQPTNPQRRLHSAVNTCPRLQLRPVTHNDATNPTGTRIALSPDRALWEQQPGEGDRAYAHFRTHLNLGRHRTLTKTSEIVTVSPGTLRHHASINRWRERCRAWDAEQDAEDARQRDEARRRAWEEDEKLARAMKGVAGAKMRSVNPEDLSNGEMINLLREAVRLSRLLYGEPTEHVAHSGPDGGELAVQISELTPDARAARLREQADMAQRMAEAAGDLGDE